MVTKGYKYNKKWRDNHRDAYNKGKLDYHAKTRQEAKNEYQLWSQEEDRQVLEHKLSDRELGKKIGRSVQAIQGRRHKLKRGEA